MKTLIALLGLTAATFAAEFTNPAAGANGWRFEELRRFKAEEARQGVAVDGEFAYVISNHALGKYRKTTGERVAGWECPEGDPFTHLNAGVAHEGRLYGAHSNYPGVPNLSSVEIWDTTTMKHVGSRSFGIYGGSLTWIDRRNGRWVACFVYYAKRGANPGAGRSGRGWWSSTTSGGRPAAGVSPPTS